MGTAAGFSTATLAVRAALLPMSSRYRRDSLRLTLPMLFVTVTAQLRVVPLAVSAYTLVMPSAQAVTTPSGLTVTMDGSALRQLTTLSPAVSSDSCSWGARSLYSIFRYRNVRFSRALSSRVAGPFSAIR